MIIYRAVQCLYIILSQISNTTKIQSLLLPLSSHSPTMSNSLASSSPTSSKNSFLKYFPLCKTLLVKINPNCKIWFLTRIGREIEWRIEKRKRICLQNLIPSRREREFFSKSRISRGERDLFLQNLDIRERLEKWKLNSPARDRKNGPFPLEIENLVNAWSSRIWQKSPAKDYLKTLQGHYCQVVKW